MNIEEANTAAEAATSEIAAVELTETELTDGEAETELASPVPVRPDSPTFADLGVRPETVAALEAVGITRAFKIQEHALPIALRGADVIGQAPTGTGKTLGFGLPLLQRALSPSEGADGLPQALVVVPTRELGIQVARDLDAAGSTRGMRVVALYGGVAYEPQTEALKRGVEIVVGTPGRLLDLAKSKQLRLDRVRALVLDEADRMLDLGFLDDVERILAMLPEDRQTMLFSATMPDPIVTLARRFMRQPVTIHAHHDDRTGPSPQTQQLVYRAHPLNKVEVVARILQAEGRGLTMIFARTKRAVDRVAEDLDFRGFAVAAVHGDLGQGARERALRAFRAGKVDVLVATDVAARGLDVSGVTHVINYDCPEDADTYTHRIGRTGRAGATGVAVTFVDWEDMPRWRLIDKSLGLDLPEPPETYHTSAHLFTDLDISTEISGTLPTADRTRAGLSAERLEDVEGKRGSGNRRGRRGESTGTHATTPASRDAATSAGRDDESAPAGSRRRRRRRTEPGTTAAAGTTATASAEVSTVDAVRASGEDEAVKRPRRRRRRGGSGSGSGSGSGRNAAGAAATDSE
jgi:superfamily II DNA/RNA helicase